MGERAYKIAVILIVAAVIVGGAWWKLRQRPAGTDTGSAPVEQQTIADGSSEAQEAPAETPGDAKPQSDSQATESDKALPAVIDLGMGKCIPCKAMKPILDELAAEYKGRARVEIIDIGERPEAAERYGVMTIPTQIFLDVDGDEVYRHEGFMPKEDIVAKLRDIGVQ